MSVSSIFPQKSRGNKKCDEGGIIRRRITTYFCPFWHRCKMAVTWLNATLLISVCSFCRASLLILGYDATTSSNTLTYLLTYWKWEN